MSLLKILLLLALPLSSQAKPHLELDLTSAEYARYLESHPSKKADEPSVTQALQLGARLSAWITFENSKRPAGQQLRLSSPGTRINYPIEAPSIYNPSRIEAKLAAALNAMPETLRIILNGTGSFPAALPLEDAKFIAYLRPLDLVYQTAARWKALKPHRAEYAEEMRNDVRGYYFLNQGGWTELKLGEFPNLTAQTQADLRIWLEMLCYNESGSHRACANELKIAEGKLQLADYYAKYYPGAQENWERFFTISDAAVRSDLVWNSNHANIAWVPFNTPTLAGIQSYLSSNIEDEWKWGNWSLKLNFGTFTNGPRVQFESGVVPHVNGVGGNIITMDQNQSTGEYESQWAIRHEFGHVLGFPDCYHEFYDSNMEAFVNYQLDTTDLMCSRTGNMKERLYLELKRVYLKP